MITVVLVQFRLGNQFPVGQLVQIGIPGICIICSFFNLGDVGILAYVQHRAVNTTTTDAPNLVDPKQLDELEIALALKAQPCTENEV